MKASKKDAGDTLVVGLGVEPKGDDAEAGDDYGEEKLDAAQALLDAIGSGDASAVADAFASLKAVC